MPFLAFGQLSGTYTINPNGSGTKNYKTFAAAVTALNSSGVNGAVVFNVSNSTYTEQITLNYVSGSSSSNTITFRGTDSSKTILQYGASQYSSVIKVNAASYFNFEKMTVKSTDNRYGYAIHITAGADHTGVKNCILEVSTASNSADCIPLNISGAAYNTLGDNGEFVTVENSILRGGYYGINMRGTNTSLLSDGLTVDNCTFEDNYYIGVYAYLVANPVITNCVIDDIRLYTGMGIYMYAGKGGRIEGNRIYPGRYGIYLTLHNYYNRSDSIQIINNEVSDFDDASYQTALYSSNTYNLRAYHNTFRSNGSVSATTLPVVYISRPNNHKIFNNSFASYGNTDVMYLGTGSLGNTEIDYNNYKVGNGGLIAWQGTNYTSLSTLQSTITTQNQNSKNEDPGYSGTRNLAPLNPGLNNFAKKGLTTKDLAGNSRPKAPDTTPDIGAYEYYVSPYDIDLIDIYKPIIAQTGNNDVSVVFKNNGSAVFSDTLMVHYRIGSSGSWVKDTAIFNGFKIGTTDTFTFTKPWNASSSGTYTACAAIGPVYKGDPDSLVGDTFCNFKCIGQQGTFTIDPSGNGDFTSFTAAVNALNCGISGPIKFNVKAGTYNERITIGSILGASSTNTITFSGDGKDKVTLKYAGTSSLPAVVLLEGTDNITFENMTVENTGTAIGAGFWIKDECESVTIQNCNILMDSTVRQLDIVGILAANALTTSGNVLPGNTSKNNTYINNLIIGGGYGLRLNGPGTSSSSDYNVVRNNIMRKQYGHGISLGYVGRSIIRLNKITDVRNLTSRGISLWGCNRDTVDRNVIQSGRYGIYSRLENWYDRNGFSLIANNMISNLLDPTYQNGIYSQNDYNTNYFHNSIWTTHSNTSWWYSAFVLYSSNNCNVKNNAIKSDGGAMVFTSYYGTVNITAVDNNCYYGTGSAKYNWSGLIFSDLNTWKTITSNQNNNSIEGDPGFDSEEDLHASGAQLNNGGQKGLDVDIDIDGHKRPFSPDKKVDIGADEYYVSPYDIDLISLDNPTVPKTGQNTVSITLKNAGIKDLSNDTVVVSYSIDNGTPVRDTVIIASLAVNATYQHTFQTNWAISTSKTYTLCAQLDTFFKPDPDSLITQKKCATMCPGAIGNFTIDRTGSGDFGTFRAAIKSLECGVSGPVTFTVKNGTYSERLTIGEINGASQNARIRFVGESRSGVKIEYTGRRDSQAVVHLEGADFINFENMTLENPRNIWSKGIYLTSNADYNKFIDVTVTMHNSTLNGTSIAVSATNANVSAVGVAANYNEFRGCNFNGAYYGVRMDGEATTTLIYGNSFYDCQFSENAYYNVYTLFAGQMTFDNCRFLSTRQDYWNVYLSRPTEITFTSNYMESGRRGLYSYLDNYYFTNSISLYANNMFHGGWSSGNTEMVDFYYCYNAQVYHNSLNVTTGNGGYAMRFRYGSGHDVRNNSLAKNNSGELFYNLSAAFVSIDYNNYYGGSSSNYVFYNNSTYSSLAAWKVGVNGFNKNSRDGDPKYTSATDLTVEPKSTQLANWGSVITNVTQDFEGDIRNTTNPDIGADEYTDLYDLGIAHLVTPKNSCKLTDDETVVVTVKNHGSIDVPSGELIPFSYSVNGGTTTKDTVALTSTLKSGDSINFAFASKYDFKTTGNYAFVSWTDIANDSTRNNDTLKATLRSFEEPKADFSFLNECTGDGTKFTDGSSISTSSISNHDWTFGDGNTGAVQSPTHKYASAGGYTAKLVVTSAQGCKDSVQKALSIGLKPTASFTTSNLCIGDSAAFTNTSSIATESNAVFTWDFDDGNSSSLISPKHKYGNTGSYDIEFIAKSSNGCSDTATTTIGISPTPTADFSTKDVCFGTSASFTNSSTIPGGFTASHSWDFGDATNSSSTSPTHSYTTVGTYTVELTTTLNNGCVDTKTTNVTVESTPVTDFNALDVCYGDSVAFSNQSSIGSGSITSTTWTFGDGNTSTSTSPKHFYSAKNTYSVKLKSVSNAGCADSLTQNVVVNEKPSAAFSLNAVCEGVATSFTNSSSVNVGNLAYAWTFGDGFTSTTKTPSHTYSGPGTYSAQLIITSDSGCTDTAANNATVNATPSVAFGVTNICFGDTLRPSNSSTISSGTISSYSWDFDDGKTSTLANPENKYTAKGTYDVKLVATSNNSCKDSLTKQVVVDNVLVPGYTTQAVCKGDSTVFVNTTNTSCGTISSYVWQFGDGNTSNLINPKHKYANSGSYTVRLIVTQQGGAKDTATQVVTVNALPSVNYSTSNVCTGSAASFSNSSTISSGSISSYTWDFGDGNKSSTTSPSHTYSSNNTYTVWLKATSNSGCVDSTSKSITSYELPSADFSASAVCLGKAVKFTNKSSISSGTLSYSWSFGDGFSSTQTSPSYTYSSAGTYTVKLTVTSNNTCVSTYSQTVTVSPNPSLAFTVKDTCANNAVRFINSSTISSGSASYKWYFGDGDSSSSVQPSHLYGSSGSYNATLVATSNVGCVSTLTKSANAYPVPSSDFSLPASCSGTKLTFTNTSSISSGSLTHAWSFGDGSSSSQTSPTHTYTSTGNYTVKLISVSARGCVDSVKKLAQVFDLPSSSFAYVGVCSGDSTDFTNTSSIASGTMTFNWSFGDGNSSTASSPKHLYTATGSYQVKLVATSNGGCNDSSTTTVVINAKPSVAFTATEVCDGSTTTFTNTSSIASGTITHFWDFGDGAASTLTSPTRNYGSSGSYTVQLVTTSNQGCKDSVSRTVAVNPNPTASFNYINSCFGDTTQFVNSSSISNGSLTYAWDFDNGSTSNIGQPKTFYNVVGSYDVELTAQSGKGCIDIETRKVHINASPSVNFVAPNVCDGNDVSFTNKSSISKGTFVNNWAFGDGNSSALASPSHGYSTPGSYSAVLTVISDSGCTDSMTKLISVNATPKAAFTSSNVCETKASSFSDNSTISSGSIGQYSWAFGDGFTSNQKAPTHTYANDGSFNVRLVVSSDSGCTDTTFKTTTVYPEPSSAFGVSNVCFGDTLKPTNTSSISSGSITNYTWNFGDGNASSIASPKHYYTAKGTYDVKLKVTSNNGCEDSLTKQVVVDIVIVPGFTQNDVCDGESMSFTNTTNTSCGNITAYSWEFGDGNSSSSASPSHSYSTAGQYSVRLIVTQQSGDKDTITKTVNVHPKPGVAFSVSNVCQNESASFSNSTSISSGSISTYEWKLGDGTKNSSTSPTHQYASKGSYSVQLKAISNEGCADSASKSLSIYEVPNAKFTTKNVCDGNDVSFSNRSSISSGPLNSTWSFGDGNGSSNTDPSHKYGANGNYTVWLKVASNNSCLDSISKTISVHPNPKAHFGATEICEGNATTFSDSSTISSGNITGFSWLFGDGFTSTTKNPAHTYGAANTYSVQLAIVSDSGCVDTTKINTTVNAGPSASFTATNLCLGDNLVPNNTSSISSGSISSHHWDFDNGDTSKRVTPTYKYASVGSYDVKLVTTSDKGCKDSVTKTVVVDVIIVPGFNFTTACAGDSSAFTNTTNVSCGNITAYEWQFGDGNTSGLSDPKHKYAQAGSYKVLMIVTQQGGAKDTSTQTVTVNHVPSANFFGSNSCAKTAVSFTNLSTIASGSITNWEWDFKDGFKDNVKNPNHTFATAGTYDVKLKAFSNNGCVDSSSRSVSIYDLPNVAFTANDECFGDAVQFNNQSTISSGSLNYNWTFGDGFSSTSTSPSYTYSKDGTFDVTLKATSNNFCSAEVTKSVKIKSAPDVNFTTGDTCTASTVRFANNTVSSSGTPSYEWTFGDGNSSTDEQPQHSYSTAGNYSIKLKATSVDGCADSSTTAINIVASPSASFTFTSTCPGDKVDFTNTSTSTLPLIGQLWQFTASPTDTARSKNSSFTFNGNGPHSTVLFVMNSAGCLDSAIRSVTFQSVPVAGFDIGKACERDSVDFTNTTTVANGTLTYLWSFGDGTITGATDPQHLYADNTVRTVKMVATSDKGCKDSISKQISFLDAPEVDFSTSALCAGKNTSFTNKTSDIDKNTYSWDFGDASSSTDQDPDKSYASAGNYTVVLTADNGTCTDTSQKLITVAEGAQNLDFDFEQLCAGDTVQFINNATNNNLTFRWAFFDGTFSTDKNPQKLYAVPGQFRVALEGSEGECADSVFKSIEIFPNPDASFTYILNEKTAQFTNLDSNFHDYMWDFGDGNTSTLQNPSHTYANSGAYQVTLTVTTENDCERTFTSTVTIQPDGVEIPGLQNFSIYPNPFRDNAVIEFDLVEPSSVRLEVFDMMGRSLEVLTSTDLNSGSHKFVLNDDAYRTTASVYQVRYTVNGISKTERLVKLR